MSSLAQACPRDAAAYTAIEYANDRYGLPGIFRIDMGNQSLISTNILSERPSSNSEKAWPKILSAFKTLGMGDPGELYDAIMTAGFQPGNGQAGTLGELSPKQRPWLYAEAARIGLGIDFQDRYSVAGIEDSGAGVCATRLAGFSPIGIGGGNIVESGTKELCVSYCESLADVMKSITSHYEP